MRWSKLENLKDRMTGFLGRRRGRRTRRQHGRRIAVFTPLPPEKTGVADYSARLIPELASIVDVDVFVSDPRVVDQLSRRIPIRPADEFAVEDSRSTYDGVLYCMGNSNYHHFMKDEMKRRPGSVLAHDVRFDGFYRLLALASGDTASFRNRLLAESPQAADLATEDGLITAAQAVAHDVYMVSEILADSTHFLVHSAYAAELAAQRASPSDSDKIEVVRFGIPPSHRVTRPVGPPLVATFGLTDPIKQPDLILEAAGRAATEVPDLTVCFVGYTDAGYQDELRGVGRAAGLIDDQIHFTGYLEDGPYHDWLSKATVAVQLRAASNGETSAAIGDCLRFGLPVIASGIGSNLEYPQGVVAVLPPRGGADILSKFIVDLVNDHEGRLAMQEAALAFADSSTFAAAAKSIIDGMGLRR